MNLRLGLMRLIARRDLLEAAISADFEVVDDRRCRVRALEVAETVASRLGVTLRYRTFFPQVNRAVAALGAERVSHGNIRMWRKLRRRGVVTWKYDGPDLGPAFPYANQVTSPNE